MDAAQWAQGLGLVKPMEDMASSTNATMMAMSTTTSHNTANTCTTTTGPQMMTERKIRPQKDQVVNCPRCNSTNTKFCYYNNYSLTQPRYFCKTCRRYWTEGGTLRNVPVGGGSRKNKRHPSTVAAATSASSNINSTVTTSSTSAAEASVTAGLNTSNKKLHVEHGMPPQDLNLAFNHPIIGELNDMNNSTSGNPSVRFSAMELLRSEMAGRSIGNFMPMQLQMQMQMQEYQYNQQPTTFGMQEFKPPTTLGFPLNGIGGAAENYGNLQGVQERSNGRLLFPFEQLKPAVALTPSGDGTTHLARNRSQGHDQDPPGFWQGMINGGDGSW